MVVSRLFVVTLLAACATHHGTGDDDTTGSDTGSDDPGGGGGGGITNHELVISPLDPTIVVNGSPSTFAFNATFDGAALANGAWSIEDVKLGLIDQTGTFKSKGFMSGAVKVSVRYGNYNASTTLHVQTRIVDNAGNLDAATEAALDSGGTADPNFKWLYPYDKTVFPRNIKSPLLQFDGGATNATRLEVSVADFSYVGYFAGTSPAAQASVPDAVWKAAQSSAGGTDDLVVKATKLTGAAVTGPISETWHVAQGNLKGSIYYNTYKSASTSTGAVMKLKPGETAQAQVMIGNCTVCHSVSANGSTVAAGLSWSSNNPAASGTFALSTMNTATPMFSDTTEKRKTSFSALTPDGAMMITNGVPTTERPRGLSGPYKSVLANAATGVTIDAPSFTTAVSYAQSPAFSPDGKHLAFSWGDTGKTAKQLATVDVDWTTTPPTFTAPKSVRTVTSGVTAWPSYFPDGTGLVYHEGDHFDTVVGQNGGASYAEVKLIDTVDGSVHNLEAMNGWLANGTTSYLPYGSTEENRRNYEPSVLPVPVGGYYWMMFTSRRAYGNTLSPAGKVGTTSADNGWGGTVSGVETPSKRKKIWVAAIDLDYHGVGDPSHPAFYLDGQELGAGNMRAYAALDVCHPTGDTCESGADCCTGFCRETSQDADGNPITSCVDQPPGCSQIDETCTVDADCCDVTDGATCINNRCAAPAIY